MIEPEFIASSFNRRWIERNIIKVLTRHGICFDTVESCDGYTQVYCLNSNDAVKAKQLLYQHGEIEL